MQSISNVVVVFQFLEQDMPLLDGENSNLSNAKLEHATEDIKILGATEVNGNLHFIYKRNGEDKPQVMSNDEAKSKYPYPLMDFYESCMVIKRILVFEKRKYERVNVMCFFFLLNGGFVQYKGGFVELKILILTFSNSNKNLVVQTGLGCIGRRIARC